MAPAFIGLAYIVSQGNITATIVWFAITTGVTARLEKTVSLRQLGNGEAYCFP